MRQKIVILIVLSVAVACVGWVLRPQLTLAAFTEHEHRLRSLVSDHPVLSRLAGFFVYIAASLFPGTTGKSVLYGWLFGFWAGIVIVNLGLTTAAVLVFLTMRYLFQSWVHRRCPEGIQRIDDALQEEGPIYLLTLRLLHAPYSLTNYALSATTVSLTTFWWTTQVGLLPGNVVFVLAGAQLPTLDEVRRQGIWSLINFPLWIGLSAATLFPLGVRWAVRHGASGKQDGDSHSPHSLDCRDESS